MSITSWRARRADHRTDEREVDRLVWAWRAACEGAGIGRIISTVTGPTTITPRVTHVTLGPPTVLVVALLPGQLADDVRAVAYRLAEALQVPALRIETRGQGYVVVRLLDRDPVADLVPLHVHARPAGAVLLGRADDEREITYPSWADAPNTIAQGVTRSGKSAWAYSLLAQVARDPAVRIAGVDPTALLLRPFTGTRHAPWHALGLADLYAIERLLERLADDMDGRIAELPPDRDTAELHPDRPCVLVVLEEWPGCLRALDATDPKLGKRVRALVSRLLAEGHKVGYRVVMLAQRAEASVVGAFERAMCSLRISFRTDNRSSVELLHPGTLPEVADQHSLAVQGVALVSMPDHPLIRMRAPWIGSYRDFCLAVQTAGQ